MPVAEFLIGLFADGVYKLIGKLFTRGVKHLFAGIVRQVIIADRVQKMRLAEAAAAVDKQRVVFVAGAFGDRQRRRVSQIVVVAHDEVFKRVFAVQHSLKGYRVARGARACLLEAHVKVDRSSGNVFERALDKGTVLGHYHALAEASLLQSARNAELDFDLVELDRDNGLDPGVKGNRGHLVFKLGPDTVPDVVNILCCFQHISPLFLFVN